MSVWHNVVSPLFDSQGVPSSFQRLSCKYGPQKQKIRTTILLANIYRLKADIKVKFSLAS